MEIAKKLKEWSTTSTSQTSSEKEKEVEKKKQIAREVIKNDLRRDKTAHDAVVDSKISREQKKWLASRQEAPNAPTDCWELDPAALPLEPRRVMTDAEREAQGKVADTSNLERKCGESKETEKSSVVGNNNVTKGEETPRVSMSLVKQPILTYSGKKKEKAKASTIEAKRKTSLVAAEGF